MQRSAGHADMIRAIAVSTLWLALVPSAFFVGRSVYWHLIHGWHLDLGMVGIGAAIVSGAMIELVGILSAHVALATARWNRRGDVQWSEREIRQKKERKRGGKERAPMNLAVACFLAYVAAAFLLAVVLEAKPASAVWAPALFTLMAAAAYISVGVYQQHRDRLLRYGLDWDWQSIPDTVSNRVSGVQSTPECVQNMDRTPSNLDNTDRAIMRTYTEQPDASYRTVANVVGTGHSTVRNRMLNRLVPAGLVERTGDQWTVHWSDNGKGET